MAGKPIREPVQDVANDSARGRRHDADHLGQVGQELLARGVEQPLRRETPLALLELREQRADARRLKRLDDELILGLAGIGRDLAGGDHFHAHFGLEAHARSGHPPHDPGEAGLLVLQVHVDMAGAMHLHRAKLRADADMAVGVLQRAPQRAGEFADRPFRGIHECCFAHSASIKRDSHRR